MVCRWPCTSDALDGVMPVVSILMLFSPTFSVMEVPALIVLLPSVTVMVWSPWRRP